MLAYRLKCSVKEIEQMNANQFMEWLAFFSLHDRVDKPNGKFS